MQESNSFSTVQKVIGGVLVALGVTVFAVRLQHEGAYATPRGTNLFAGLGALIVGGVLVTSVGSELVRRIGLALSPIVLFLGLYATGAELEEVISMYATDSSGNPAELRLWIIDREDGAWVGMPRWKAIEHSLDGARVEILRAGKRECVVPKLFEDRPTVRAVHADKVRKYAVAQAAAAIGIYPSEARDAAVSLRLDPCPEA